MKNNNKSNDLDLFTPIVEIFHELCMMVVGLITELAKYLWRRITKSPAEVKKIERKALSSKKSTIKPEALGVDTRSKKDILLKDIDFTKHSFIVGASGYGKTNLISMLQENNLKQDKPIIFIDPKGDMGALKTFKRLCEKNNRPCYVFSEHYEDSISLNPVLEGSVSLVKKRIMDSFEWSEPYYKNQCKITLSKALNKIKEDGHKFTLKRIYDYVCELQTKDNLGLVVQLQEILESDFGKILSSEDGLTFSQIRKERACLYIGLSTQGFGETAVGVGKLFLNELLYNSYSSLIDEDSKANALSNPISVYFDEFGAVVTSDIIELQNKCRGAGIELTMAVQTIADINKIDLELTNQVVENANNLFILKQRLQDNAAYFAEAIGTIMAKKNTFQTENGEKGERGTEREVQELIVHPDIIKNLRVGQCVLLRQSPTQINLINIRNRQMEAFKKVNKLIEEGKVTLNF
jgi:conjugal transfer pilus assembly protein TraD